MQPEADAPLVKFYRFLPGARAPERADRSAAGSMPTRAFRYCEAMRTASALGWYVFPPMSFKLMWDGANDVIWSYEGETIGISLNAVQFPNFAAHFDSVAPPEVQGYSPPFLGSFKDPAGLMLWSGFVARTAPGWSLLVRPPANLTRSQAYESYEGIIETDRWFGPLFVNLKLTRPNVPIEFDANYPFLQVQPVHRRHLRRCARPLRRRRRARRSDAGGLGRLSPHGVGAVERSASAARRIRGADAQAAQGGGAKPDLTQRKPVDGKNISLPLTKPLYQRSVARP